MDIINEKKGKIYILDTSAYVDDIFHLFRILEDKNNYVVMLDTNITEIDRLKHNHFKSINTRYGLSDITRLISSINDSNLMKVDILEGFQNLYPNNLKDDIKDKVDFNFPFIDFNEINIDIKKKFFLNFYLNLMMV